MLSWASQQRWRLKSEALTSEREENKRLIQNFSGCESKVLRSLMKRLEPSRGAASLGGIYR